MLRFKQLSDYKKYRKKLAQEDIYPNEMEEKIVYDLFLIDIGYISGIMTELIIADETEAEAFRELEYSRATDIIAREVKDCGLCGAYCREMYDTLGGKIILLYTKLGGTINEKI